LLLGIIAALVAGRRYSWGALANTFGLALSTGYLVWTLGAKLHVEIVARNALQQQNITATDVLTTPSPFNSLLWRILVVDDRHYYEGYYSVFDDSSSISFEQHSRHLELLEPLNEIWPVQRLRWFTKKFYTAALSGNDIVITDLRMGAEPEYVFRFKVGEMGNPHARPAPVERLPGIRNYERLGWVWDRIWDSRAEM
jgi:inner membrane protein